MLLMFRLTYSGIIFNYINTFYDLTNLGSIFRLYAISYAGINIALLLYFREYFRFYERSKSYHLTIYAIIAFRVVLFMANEHLPKNFNVYCDIAIQLFLLCLAIRTSRTYFKQSILTIISLAILIIGNVLFMFPSLLSLPNQYSYDFYLNLASLEVMVFAIGMAYRNNFLKKQHDDAVAKTIYALKESEALKENLNKELEKQVAERTKQIQEMNELLQLHNIKLTSEVKNANEARAFQKRMNFADFQKIFPDDESCFKYLAQLKWKPNEVIKCRKCGYEKHAVLPNLSIRCGKCSYIESVTYGTLFQKLKFSILKAFYIAYLTSTSQNNTDATIAALAKEIDLRPATLWTFKQKVLTLMEANKTRKKHKDGWTHLIEYSITK